MAIETLVQSFILVLALWSDKGVALQTITYYKDEQSCLDEAAKLEKTYSTRGLKAQASCVPSHEGI
ncbi:MAG: hypothetical protein JNM27_03780 [Leptospirales bacterium]|nr:hypothetical protein [Leptospirales bacterium]